MINWTDLYYIKNLILKELNNIFKVYRHQVSIYAEDINLLKSKKVVLGHRQPLVLSLRSLFIKN